ncbi:MAG: holo-[acyl-carrier-protein] synthase [Ruminococcaceae bacterium]|nr:holo-[acyl-carrier-protein] synthase [Oscillospiraceae bacterium]
MIVGIGTDIVKIDRINKACENPRFLEEYFSGRENTFFRTKKNMTLSVANNFAAKEAFSKALGTGVRGFSMREVEVLRDELGKPYIELCGKALECAKKINAKNIHVTLSNTDTDAIAFVVLEGEAK